MATNAGAGTTLERPPDARSSSAVTATAYPDGQPQLLLGRYRVERELSAHDDGDRRIVVAFDEQEAQRLVAIKICALAGGRTSPDARREYRRLLTLERHHAIVTVYDVHIDEALASALIVMEYVEDGTLADWMEQGVNPRDLRQIISWAAAGLHWMHSSGIVHSDVKPDNLAMRWESGGPIVKLLDLGTSIDADEQRFAGSPGYMSPRVGPSTAVDADWWALGIILAELAAPGERAPALYRRLSASRSRDGLAHAVRDNLRRRLDGIADSAALEAYDALTAGPASHGIRGVDIARAFVRSQPPGAPLRAPRSPLPQHKVGDFPYRIVGPIGAGGYGEVYLAQDDDRGSQFAVKYLQRELLLRARDRLDKSARDIQRRFEKEAAIGLELRHPNIVHVIAHGIDQGLDPPRPFIVMEYLAGGTVADRMRSATDADIACWVQETAAGLTHIAPMVHRDITPANLLLTLDGHVKITDFGLVREARGSDTPREALLGARDYLAPEAIRRFYMSDEASDEPRPGEDQYALAVVAYELLSCGRHPRFDERERGTEAGLLSRIQRDVRPIEGRSPAIMAVLERSLSGHRYESAQAFASALSAALTPAHHAPPSGATATDAGHARPRVPAHRGRLVGATAVVAAAAIAGWIAPTPIPTDHRPLAPLAAAGLSVSAPAGWTVARAGRADGVTSGWVAFDPEQPELRLIVGALQNASAPRDPLRGVLRPARAEPAPSVLGRMPLLSYTGNDAAGQRVVVRVVLTHTGPRAAACRAPHGMPRAIEPCERALSTLRANDGAAVSPLVDSGLARRLRAAIEDLGRRRQARAISLASRRMTKRAATARALATAHADAARAIGAGAVAELDAAAVQRLRAALDDEESALRRLAYAAQRGEPRTYDRRRNAVTRADTAVYAALDGLRRNGYLITHPNKNR